MPVFTFLCYMCIQFYLINKIITEKCMMMMCFSFEQFKSFFSSRSIFHIKYLKNPTPKNVKEKMFEQKMGRNITDFSA